MKIQGRSDTAEEDRIAADNQKTQGALMGVATTFAQSAGQVAGGIPKTSGAPEGTQTPAASNTQEKEPPPPPGAAASETVIV